MEEKRNNAKQKAAAVAKTALTLFKIAKTGINPVRLAIVIAGIIVFFLLAVACLFDIIFYELGFDSSSEMQTEMMQEETENIKETLRTCFSDEDAQKEVNRLFAEFKDRKSTYDKSVKLPDSGVLKSSYDEIDTTYGQLLSGNTSDTVVYDGYSVTNNSKDIWENETYLSYFVPMIQNQCSDGVINKIENGDSKEAKEAVENCIKTKDYWGDWDAEEKQEKEETIKEKKKYYTYIGKEKQDFYDLDISKKYYVDKLEGLDGLTKKEWVKRFKAHPDLWKKKKEVVEKKVIHKKMVYKISLVPPENTNSVVSDTDQEYTIVDNEETLETAIQLLEDLTDGKYGASLKDLLKLGRQKIKGMLNLSKLEKKFSWRTTTSSRSFISIGNSAGGGSEVGQAAVKEALKHVGEHYSQSRRDEEGYYDCSSLIYRSYVIAGLKDMKGMSAAGEAQYCAQYGLVLSGPEELQPGDLIFYSSGTNGRYKNITHVAMYAGEKDGNRMRVHARSVGLGVCYDEFQEIPQIVMYGRPYKSSLATNVADTKGMFQFLVKSGYTPAGAAGIMGNLQQESNFNPTESTGRYFGIMQLGDDRLENMKAYAKKIGQDYRTIDAQLNWLIYELKEYQSLNKYLQTTKDPEMAAQEFCAGYERPVTSNPNQMIYTGDLYPKLKNKQRYQELDKRIRYAREIYNANK